MKCSRMAAIGLVFVFSAGLFANVLAAGEKKPVWRPLWDRKTLDGWHRIGVGDWTIEKGAIVGRKKADEPEFGHLVSDKVFKDFTVRLRFKALSGNSGFYFRIEEKGATGVSGFQAEIDATRDVGGLYETNGRAWVVKPKPGDVKKWLKLNEWNEMIVTAEGGHIIVHVNGIKTAELTDDPGRAEGRLALQLHGGNDMLVMFKNIEILEVGKIIPKTFIGFALEPIAPANNSTLCLHAAAGNGVGPKIMYMPEWGAFGWFTDKDRVEWVVEVAKAGPYDVWLEWSVSDRDAGDPFVFEVGDERVTGTVNKTGGWDTYRKTKIGRMQLKAGSQRAVFKPGGRFETALLDLRQLRLVPTTLDK